MRPNFSTAMLRLFLRARCRMAAQPGRRSFQADSRRERDRLRRLAGVTAVQMDLAWMGRLESAEPRVRLWAVLGHHPGDHGVVLTHGGQALG
ncbi:hypothetical protein GA830_12090 [Mesorhizobium sp. NBSH29]|nr:hypothetical protein GA830_12090 [Mesorhizobium sp. NBSH29]